MQVIAETVYAIRASFRTDDPVGYRFFKSERIPDRHHEIAGLDRVRIAELQRFQPRLVDFEHRQIHDRIRANEFRLLRPAIAQLHLDLVHLVHHVTVRDDVPLGRHYHAGPERILHHRFLVGVPVLTRVTIKKIRRIKLILPAERRFLRRLDAHHGWNDCTDQRPTFPVQILQARDILWVDARTRRQ